MSRLNPKNKIRLDDLLVKKRLAPTKSRAAAMILSGNVLIDDVPATKSGQLVLESNDLRIRAKDHPYVSRGGIKLEKALQLFEVNGEGVVALDIGASTGGFTDCLLQNGARKVFALDVGHGQLDWKIRSDPRVIVIEKTNAKNLEFSVIGQKVDLIVVDVAFISLTKIVQSLLQFSRPDTNWITLIKPQFEVGKNQIGKGGIVPLESSRQEAISLVQNSFESHGLQRLGLIESPIQGTDGNTEYLAYWKCVS